MHLGLAGCRVVVESISACKWPCELGFERRYIGKLVPFGTTAFARTLPGKAKSIAQFENAIFFGQKRGIRVILGVYHFWHACGPNCAQECHAIPRRKFDEGQRGTMEFPTSISRSETEISKNNAYAWHSAFVDEESEAVKKN